MLKYPRILAMLLGGLATLTLPPFYLFPLIVLAYGGLFWLLNRADSPRQAMKIGFFWGWGFYISGLYWFVIALMTDPDKFAWLIPFALFALTAVIALYTLVFSRIYYRFRHPGVWGAVIFSSLWTVVELARGVLFTGFPWNLAGYAFAANNATIQLASLVGVYGLTWSAVFLGAICFADKRVAAASWMVLAVAVGWGNWRAQTAPRQYVDGVMLRLVQANIQQAHKWNPALQIASLRKHVELGASAGADKITHIIWPESSVPYVVDLPSTLTVRLGMTLLKPQQYLITGMLRRQQPQVFNSMVAISSQGEVVGTYDKHKLVPFGEFLPFRRLIPDVLETPVGMQDLASGIGPEILHVPGLPPFSPLICYEVIFPWEVIPAGQVRPEWLLSITNDAWFGESTGPYQHLAAARMRAVEQGLPMVRVANTGISAVFDAYGREEAHIPLNQEGIMDVRLPAQSKNDTVYRRILGL